MLYHLPLPPSGLRKLAPTPGVASKPWQRQARWESSTSGWLPGNAPEMSCPKPERDLSGPISDKNIKRPPPGPARDDRSEGPPVSSRSGGSLGTLSLLPPRRRIGTQTQPTHPSAPEPGSGPATSRRPRRRRRADLSGRRSGQEGGDPKGTTGSPR